MKNVIDLTNIREKLYIKVCSFHGHEEQLKDCPHLRVLDLAVTAHIALQIEGGTITSMRVTHDVCREAGMEEDLLMAEALVNAPRLFPPRIESLSDMLRDIAGVDTPGTGMTVVTNDICLEGAAALFYPGMLTRLSEKLQGGYIILPSSRHEMLLVSDRENLSAGADELNEMITQINDTEVPEEDRLSYQAYHYDPESDTIETMAEYETKNKCFTNSSNNSRLTQY